MTFRSIRLRTTLATASLAVLSAASAIVGSSLLISFWQERDLVAEVRDEARRAARLVETTGSLPKPVAGIRLDLVSAPVPEVPPTVVRAAVPVKDGQQLLVAATRHPSVPTLALLALFLLVALPALLVAVVLAGSVTRPVEQFARRLGRLAPWDPQSRLEPGDWGPELGSLAGSFNQLLDRLEESMERMVRFTADAAHELRTPISIMRTGLEVALRRSRTVSEYTDLLRENLVEIERIQRVVDGLLILARKPGRTGPMPMRRIDLGKVLSEALKRFDPRAKESEVHVSFSLAPSAWILGSADQVHLLVLNLLDNAARYTPQGKTVTLRLVRQEGEARILVSDEGPGIPEEQRGRVFERYFRGPSGEASSGIGGIGLSVVAWVAEHMGGRVRLLDTAEPGAHFEVAIPLADPTTPSAVS